MNVNMTIGQESVIMPVEIKYNMVHYSIVFMTKDANNYASYLKEKSNALSLTF